MSTRTTERTLEVVAARRVAIADGSWMLWTACALLSVWVAVVLVSVFAPDLVTGTQQEHLPLAAFVTWLWGLGGTVGVVWAMNRLRGNAERKPIWIGLSGVLIAIWAAAALLGIFLPTMETGTDPTRIPLGALFAPLAAALLTVLAGIVAVGFGRMPEPD